jgi:hypothetical protein
MGNVPVNSATTAGANVITGVADLIASFELTFATGFAVGFAAGFAVDFAAACVARFAQQS